MVDIANRTIRRRRLSVQRYLSEEVSHGNATRTSYHGPVGMRLTAVRMTLQICTARALLMLNISPAPKKACIVSKAQHQLRRENENRSYAQRKKSILSSDSHESCLSEGAKLVKRLHRHCRGARASASGFRSLPMEVFRCGKLSERAQGFVAELTQKVKRVLRIRGGI
jgi:hypothetical protein